MSPEFAFELKWGDLSAYNAEVARGIMHTAEYKGRMAEKQRRYNVEVLGFSYLEMPSPSISPREKTLNEAIRLIGEVMMDRSVGCGNRLGNIARILSELPPE